MPFSVAASLAGKAIQADFVVWHLDVYGSVDVTTRVDDATVFTNG
jgi:hypothetical protein